MWWWYFVFGAAPFSSGRQADPLCRCQKVRVQRDQAVNAGLRFGRDAGGRERRTGTGTGWRMGPDATGVMVWVMGVLPRVVASVFALFVVMYPYCQPYRIASRDMTR